MIPLYILGMLLRFGPQHGYQIKKLLTEQLADFTEIKLPTIYYHLEKMEGAGLIEAHSVKEGVRPEKRVYAITEAGRTEFGGLLVQTLELEYRPTFPVDSALFFTDYVDRGDFRRALECHVSNLNESLRRLASHRDQVLSGLPAEMRGAAELIFSHHECHYQAELGWAERAAKEFEEAK